MSSITSGGRDELSRVARAACRRAPLPADGLVNGGAQAPVEALAKEILGRGPLG